MDILKDAWLQGGLAGVAFAIVVYANWLQWKRATAKDEQLLAITKEFGEVAARSSASADKMADALNRNSTAFQELSLLVAGRGAIR